MSKVRTRFAPSPTGLLHVGGIRTALYNYLFAKKHDGQFILRLEDTDRERFVASGVEQIVEGLEWAAIIPDDGFWISDGVHQKVEYIQSERHKNGLYQKYADKLVSEGLAYHSHIKESSYAKYKKRYIEKSLPFIYRKKYEIEHHEVPNKSTNKPIRLDITAIKEKFLKEKHSHLYERVDWDDEVRGAFSNDLSLIEDFIIIKSDGYPTYNFANVIDDHDMAISHVIRGDEFISSTAKHVLLYELFSWQKPKFVHLPVINGADGKKLSKRTGDTDVLEYRTKGYLPEALLNFLALLGWNDGTEQEIFSLGELQSKFDLGGLNSSPAIFDPKRLDWMNGAYIRELDVENLYKLTDGFWPVNAVKMPKEYKLKVLALVQERLKFLAELPELTSFFFEEPASKNVSELLDNPTDKQLKKTPKTEYKPMLEQCQTDLQNTDFTAEALDKTLNALLDKLNTKPGVLFALIRVAVTGSSFSPPISQTLETLGKETSLSRIKKADGLL